MIFCIYSCPWNGKFYNQSGERHESLSAVYKHETTQKLEQSFNEAIKTYVHLYYGSEAISSAFVDDSSENLMFVVLVKKRAEPNDEDPCTSVWDSVHVIEVVPIMDGSNEDEFTYYHTATVMLSFETDGHSLAGNLMRQVSDSWIG